MSGLSSENEVGTGDELLAQPPTDVTARISAELPQRKGARSIDRVLQETPNPGTRRDDRGPASDPSTQQPLRER